MKGKNIIIVQGSLDTKWKDWFEGMAISYAGNNTMLTGNIKDEAHLHGILNQIRDLNLKLISVNPAGKKIHNSPEGMPSAIILPKGCLRQ
jgi:hypothetical protein